MLTDKYFLIYLIIIISILFAIILYANSIKLKEGFSLYSTQDTYTKAQEKRFWNNTNKALSINSEFGDLKGITQALQTTDTLNNNRNKAVDHTVYFEKDILPGVVAKAQDCSTAQEPRLMPKQKNEYGTGCGWWYVNDVNTPSLGANGTKLGPYDTKKLEKEGPNGVWMWDLKEAQKKEDIKRCRRVNSCEVADLVPGKCGFCTTFLGGVPVNASGNSLYPDDPALNCDGSIVTNPNKCPRPTPPAASPDNPLPSALSQPQAGLCDPNPATGQLTAQCLITLARGAGCTDNSPIINILSGDGLGYFSQPGSNNLKFKMAVQTIKTDTGLASPDVFFGVGTCSRSEALGYYSSIVKTSSNGPTEKSKGAAGFLAFGKNYDECTANTNETGPFELHCLQRVAREAGCQPDGTDYPMESIKPVTRNVPKQCGFYGYPSSDGNIRLYTQKDCSNLNGNFYPNGECLKREGGSYSWECRELNKIQPPKLSTKDKYDIMNWGSVLQYFKDLYENMHSSDANLVSISTKKCLGITIAEPEADCGDVKGVSYYVYKWDYDYNVSSGKIPNALYYGRMYKSGFVEISNNGPYTNFGIGTDRIYMRVKGVFKNKGDALATKLWVQTDDGIAIRVDGKDLLQKWFDQGPTSYETAPFTIRENNQIPFEMDWYNNYGGYVFATRLWLKDAFVPVPSEMLRQSQPSGYPVARWDFYEGIVEDRCQTLNSQVVGSVPFTSIDGKKCALFTDKNYIEITNGIASTAFRSITMMVYIKSSPQGYPRFWEFNNSKLGDNGNWCQDSIFGTASPNNSQGMGFYCMKDCNKGPSAWSGSDNVHNGKWHHMAWTIDSTGTLMESYIDGKKVTSMNDKSNLLKNKTYKNMYIMNCVEMFDKNMAVAWFRIYDYTLTAADIKADRMNSFSSAKLFPVGESTGWTK